MRTPFRKPWYLEWAVKLAHLLGRVPWIRMRIADTIGGLNGSIIRCWGKEDYASATKTAIYALKKYRHRGMGAFRGMNHHNWWEFMRYAVYSLSKMEACEDREKLISYARNGIEPFEGYSVAYSFYYFSRWRYEVGNIQEATDFAKIAAAADATWGEPDFLMGWYGLVQGDGDVADHLSNALSKDPRLIFRVMNDPMCMTRPDLLARLKEMAVVRRIVDES